MIGLGSNLGDRVRLLTDAVRALQGIVAVDRVSSLWDTEPVGMRDQPRFLNAVLLGRTERPPRALLATLVDIEERLGRERRVPNGPRTIDLDLVAYEGMTLDEPGLAVPHPRASKRRFVLAPLCEIATDLRLTAGGPTAAELLAELPARESVQPYPHPEWPPPTP